MIVCAETRRAREQAAICRPRSTFFVVATYATTRLVAVRVATLFTMQRRIKVQRRSMQLGSQSRRRRTQQDLQETLHNERVPK